MKIHTEAHVLRPQTADDDATLERSKSTGDG